MAVRRLPHRVTRELNNRLRYLTAIVLLNAAVNLVHGFAHLELQVIPALADSLFIIIVVGVAPLIALLAIFKSSRRAGGSFLCFSLLASLIYGIYHHFLISGSDNAFTMPGGGASTFFLATALLLIVTQTIGSWMAATLVLRGAARSRHEFLK